MTLLSILGLAVGLAMDATAAAATRGLVAPRVRVRDAFTVALLFGGCQGIMPLLGWWFGRAIGRAIEAWDHWVAFVLLAGIGMKMVYEALERREPSEEKSGSSALHPRVLFGLAIATSLDAFAAGVTLPLVGAPVFASAAIIAVTTAVLSVVGLFAGRRLGKKLGKGLELAGGAILVVLGAMILFDHLQAQ